MLGSFGKVFTRLSPLIFNKKNNTRLIFAAIITLMLIPLNLLLPFIFFEIVNLLYNGGKYSLLGIELSPVIIAVVYGVVWTTTRAIPVIRRLLVNPVVNTASFDLVHLSMEHLTNSLSHRYHVSTPYSDVNELLQKCILGTNDYVSQLFTQVIPTSIDVLSAAIFLSIKYEWEVGACLGGIIGIYGIYNNWTATYIIDARAQMLKARFQTFTQIASIRNNFDTIHVFNNSPYELRLLREKLNALDFAATRTLDVPDKISLGQILVIGLGVGSITAFSVYNVLSGRYSVSNFIIISYYLLQSSLPLMNFGEGLSKIRAASVDLEKVIDFLNMPAEVVDHFPQRPINLKLSNAEIKFENVKFGYDLNTPILKGVTFTAPAGKKTGIVGISGAGKTTIAKLLYRFYDVNSGSIKINNQDIRDVSLSSLRSALGLVPQNPILFNNTLKMNVWYGAISVHGNTPDNQNIYHALEKACLTDLINSHPDGLERMLGERGLKISGGQLQRVAIARALLKDPAIFVFDEATSALDSNIEEEIQKNLDEVSKGVTTLVITHRLSTITNADWIIVLSDGTVVEEGTHMQLVERGGKYKELWFKQRKNFITDIESPFEQINDLSLRRKEKEPIERTNPPKFSTLKYSRFHSDQPSDVLAPPRSLSQENLNRDSHATNVRRENELSIAIDHDENALLINNSDVQSPNNPKRNCILL